VGIAGFAVHGPGNVFWHINLLEPDNEKNSSIISEMNWKVCAY
jgi:hypothetical protein